MKKREQEFCTKLQKWLRHNMNWSFLWEAKVVDLSKKKNYQYRSDTSFYKELINMLAAGKQVVYKFSDIARLGTPCDGFKIHNAPGYFFIKFFAPRKKSKVFYSIEASTLNSYIKRYNPKSITEEICRRIGNEEYLK